MEFIINYGIIIFNLQLSSPMSKIFEHDQTPLINNENKKDSY